MCRERRLALTAQPGHSASRRCQTQPRCHRQMPVHRLALATSVHRWACLCLDHPTILCGLFRICRVGNYFRDRNFQRLVRRKSYMTESERCCPSEPRSRATPRLKTAAASAAQCRRGCGHCRIAALDRVVSAHIVSSITKPRWLRTGG